MLRIGDASSGSSSVGSAGVWAFSAASETLSVVPETISARGAGEDGETLSVPPGTHASAASSLSSVARFRSD